MTRDISNHNDVIDSRDIIERIEELEALRKPWVAGFNMPGYLPDSEPSRFDTWGAARDYIVSELEREAESYQESMDDWQANADGEAAIERLNAATDEVEYGETIGNWHYWITHDDSDNAFDEPSDYEELKALKALSEEAEAYAPDWRYGATLIRDSYFKRYAEELADDIGAINSDATWPNNCIDWDHAARELQMDYTSVEFDGVTYWVR
jgi:hypothetical protein